MSLFAGFSYIWGAPEWIGDGKRIAYTVSSGACYTDELVNCGTNIMVARIDNGRTEVLMPAAGLPSWRQ